MRGAQLLDQFCLDDEQRREQNDYLALSSLYASIFFLISTVSLCNSIPTGQASKYYDNREKRQHQRE